MRGRRRPFPQLSGDDAIAALRWLVATKRIRLAEIKRALAKRQELVREIRQQLEELGGKGFRLLRKPGQQLERRQRRRPGKVSAAQQAAWRRQGRYLAAVRPLSKAARAKVKRIRAAKGLAAAFAEAQKIRRDQ